MVITLPASRPGDGARPIDPHRDFPELAELLALVFGSELDTEGQRLFQNASTRQSPSLTWRIDPVLARLSPGYVWVEDGRIVGNATILQTRSPRRFLVANVAVHPDHRRRGIARRLMWTVAEDIRRRGAAELELQVVRENDAAVSLYQSMGFRTLGYMTTWSASASRLRNIAAWQDSTTLLPPIRSLPEKRWRDAYELDRQVVSPDLHWPEPLAIDAYLQTWWRSLVGFMSGQKGETWVAIEKDGRLTGLSNIHSEWGRPYDLQIRVHPERKGMLERPLLDWSITRLRLLGHRSVRVVHPADDEEMNGLLEEANLRRHRTLTHMRLLLND